MNGLPQTVERVAWYGAFAMSVLASAAADETLIAIWEREHERQLDGRLSGGAAGGQAPAAA